MERVAKRIEALLGHALVGRADYYIHSTAQQVAAATGYFAAGVTFATEIHSIEACSEHELVHLVAGQLGNPGRFFHEGLAVVLGDRARWQGRSVDQAARRVRTPVRTMVDRFADIDDATSYAAAGSFVGHLIKAYGIVRVAAFFRACPPGTKDVGKAFAQVFGTSIEDADADWRASV